MPLRKTARREAPAHLEARGPRRGMKVVVHASLLAFGDVEGWTPTFIEEPRRAVGAEGTVTAPTFALHLTADEIFDPGTTPCMTGALSEAMRKLPGAVHRSCPMHGYVAP